MTDREARQEALRLAVALLRDTDDLMIYLAAEDEEAVAEHFRTIRDELEQRVMEEPTEGR